MARPVRLPLFPALIAACAAGTFAQQAFRPAVLNNLAELEFIKTKVAAGAAPWKAAYDKLRTSTPADPARSPKPRATVECGPYNEPNFGCNDESTDSKAAYAHALLWRLTGDAAHASKSAAFLDAWSATLKSHTNHNAPLQASWTAPLFARAAVILKETYPAWPAANRERLSKLFIEAFLPLIRNGNPTFNGNWELSYVEALMSIAVYTGDTAAWNQGVFLWRKRVPAYLYLKTDGERPIKPYGTTSFDKPAALEERWYNPRVWPDGLAQETCRDFGHTQMGIAAAVNAAEIAWKQGLDLYTGEARRITAAMEFHAGLLLGNPAPAGLCGGTLDKGLGQTWEIAYNHYHDRMGMDLPLTRRLILERVRPSGIGTHMAWESLTHAEIGRHVATTALAGRPASQRSAPGRFMATASGLRWVKDGRLYGLDGGLDGRISAAEAGF